MFFRIRQEMFCLFNARLYAYRDVDLAIYMFIHILNNLRVNSMCLHTATIIRENTTRIMNWRTQLKSANKGQKEPISVWNSSV